jgi:uncharacterized repeat protein (TIGR01451 family)
MIPATALQTFTDSGGGTVIVDNRGVWTLEVFSGTDASFIFAANFTVHDPAKQFVDLSLHHSTGTSESDVTAGSGSVFRLFLTNLGPDAAQTVVLSDTVPANTTFTSMSETTALGFICGVPDDGGVFTCRLDSMPAGATAEFEFAYAVNSAVPDGTLITNNASVASSDTPCNPPSSAFTPCEIRPDDNSSSYSAKVRLSAGSETCTLICHANLSAIANTTQGSTRGAFVTFGAASPFGNCGAIDATFDGIPMTDPPTDPPSHVPASGAFYPLGTTLINVTSATGGGSCSFTITVVEGTPPTITCPPDKTVTASSPGGTHSFMDGEVGTPTTNPSTGVIVTFERSDNIPATYDSNGNVAAPAVVYSLTDPFPSGSTGINWTVTDSNGLAASCTQRILVHDPCASDAQPPTITAPPNVTVSTGPNSTTCGVALSPSDGQLGVPEAHDDCSVVVTTTGIPPGNLFPVGVTTVTYTATDGAGHTASATQLVTVVDNTPPVIVAPANASYVCPSDVPAGSPSQAHGNNPGLPNGGPVFDNCGILSVTVADSSTGAGSAASPLIITRTYTATDIHNNSSSAVQTITVIDNTPPTFTFVPAAVTAYTGPNATTCDTVVNPGTATATDNCGAVTVTRSPSGNTFSVGNTTITWTATDAAGNLTTATQTVTVIDNTPPTLTPPANVTAYTGASATSCGTVVSDTVLGNATASDNCSGIGSISTTGVPSGNFFPVGTTTLTYSVTDAHNNTTTSTQSVTVIDNTLPVITTNGQTLSMWPPNHKYQTVQLTNFVTGASDNCGGVSLSNVVIEKVTSDEIENGNGDGNTTNDIVIASNCKSVQLRSEREGDGNGRVYTITFKVTDTHGNVGRATAKVVVPHNPGETPVDSGVHYTVNGTCP